MTTSEDLYFYRVMELMLSKDETSYEDLRKMLEEAMIKKYDHAKGLDNLRFKSRFDALREETKSTNDPAPTPSKRKSQDETGRNSDNELVLTLLKDDLTCVTCRDMNVSAGNQLIECHLCHALYHQECHNPYINDSELGTSWMCSSCKYRARKSSKHSSSSSSRNSSHGNKSSSYSKSSKQYGSGSSSSKSSHSGGSSHSGSPVAKSPSSSSGSSGNGNAIDSTSSASSRVIVPNINIVSGNTEKRLHIIKRKSSSKSSDKSSKEY